MWNWSNKHELQDKSCFTCTTQSNACVNQKVVAFYVTTMHHKIWLCLGYAWLNSQRYFFPVVSEKIVHVLYMHGFQSCQAKSKVSTNCHKSIDDLKSLDPSDRNIRFRLNELRMDHQIDLIKSFFFITPRAKALYLFFDSTFVG